MIKNTSYKIAIIFIFTLSCNPNIEEEKTKSFEERGLEFCLLGMDDAKEWYVEDNILSLDFGLLDNKGREAYRLILRSYDKDLKSYGNIPNQYHRNLDSIKIHQDTFAFYDHCYEQFVDAIIQKRYGASFYDEVRHKADSLIQHETIESINDKYWELYAEDTLLYQE